MPNPCDFAGGVNGERQGYENRFGGEMQPQDMALADRGASTA